MAPELSMQTVPSLNITYTEEKVRCCGCGGVVGLARGVVRGAGVVEGREGLGAVPVFPPPCPCRPTHPTRTLR